jgi:enolase
MIDGGRHAVNALDLQEFLVFPGSFKSYTESLELGVTIYKNLKKVLERNYLSSQIGDVGGFAPNLAMNQDALSLISQAIDAARIRLGYDVFLGIDAAANTFFADGHYRIKDRTIIMKGSDLSAYYQELISKHHLIYIEDPFAEDDWDSWAQEFPKLSENAIITGDDLTATNPLRLQTALEKKAISGITIKPNQIGTVMEAIAVVALAKLSGLKVTVSNRSGETNDDFLADFAVAVGADYLKFGAPARGEQIAKYNRLLEIDQELKQR